MLTRLEIIDRTLTRITAQGAPAIDYNGICIHFDPYTGNKCAVGILLASDDDARAFDNNGWTVSSLHADTSQPTPWKPYLARAGIALTSENLALLTALQNAHDAAASDDRAFLPQFTDLVEAL